MDKKDVKKFMGRFPDRMLSKKELVSKRWKCSACKKDFISDESVTNPAPCTCGSIFFEMIK